MWWLSHDRHGFSQPIRDGKHRFSPGSCRLERRGALRRPILLAATFALAVLAVTCAAAALSSPYNRLRWSGIMIDKAAS